MDTGLAFEMISDAFHVGQDRAAFLGMVWSGWIGLAWSHLIWISASGNGMAGFGHDLAGSAMIWRVRQ